MLEASGFKRKTKETIEKPSIDPNLLLPTREFARDIQALLFLIKHELDLALSVINAQLASTDIMREDLIKTEANRVTMEIVNSLSPDYAQLLMLYFSEKALINFITKTVLSKLLSTAFVRNKQALAENKSESFETRKDI